MQLGIYRLIKVHTQRITLQSQRSDQYIVDENQQVWLSVVPGEGSQLLLLLCRSCILIAWQGLAVRLLL
jgi:hypothetical protein